MKRLFTKPTVCLLLIGVGSLGLFTLIFGWQARSGLDTHVYLNFPTESLRAMLSQIATPGYGLFLSAFSFLSPRLAFLPQIQFVVFFGAVIALFAALRVYGFSAWLALFTATPLFFSGLLWRFGPEIMTETLAGTFVILTISCAFWVSARPRSFLGWISAGLCLFTAYQFRPVFMFLIGFVPLLIWVLSALRSRGGGSSSSLVRSVLYAVIASLLPLLAFSCLRSVVVGHFGAISSAGYHMVGISAEYLTPDMALKLDPDLRPLAMRIIEKRDALGLGIVRHDWFPVAGPPDFIRRYNGLVLFVFTPVAIESLEGRLPSSEEDLALLRQKHVVAIQEIAQSLAWSTLKAHPTVHILHWVMNFVFGVGTALWCEPIALLLLMTLFLIYVSCPIATKGGAVVYTNSLGARQDADCFKAILFAGISFLLVKMLVVAMFEPPLPRYIRAASLFLPSVVGAGLFLCIRNCNPLAAWFGLDMTPKVAGSKPADRSQTMSHIDLTT